MAAHLVVVWLVGCVLTAVQFEAALIAVFMGGGAGLASALAVGASLSVALFAALGRAARPLVPLTRRRRGPWTWAAVVYALGTACAIGVLVVNFQVNRLENAVLLFPAGGVCYAFAAALLLPGARTRLAVLATAAVLAGGGGYAAWEAAQPPALGEWLTANGVDRSLLRVGDAPPGHTLSVAGAGRDGFNATYRLSAEPGAPSPLLLHVKRAADETRRADARGCPVPFGGTIRCADDGGGRLLVVYGDGRERQELWLRRDGLVHIVTVRSGAGLPAARHVLSTLRPATDAELAGLVEPAWRR